jgi:two-component system sensor histidine kinase QseC
MKKNYSLKKRLLKWISFPILVISFLILLIAAICSWHEIEEVYDAQLVHLAKTLLQLTEHKIEDREYLNIPLGLENPNLQHRYENKMAFRIWSHDKIILQSTTADKFVNVEAPPGFSNQKVNGKPWRFFVYIDAEKYIKIETAERYAIRYELIGQLMTSLAIPMAILIPLLLFIVWIGVHKSITPIIALSSEVDARKIDDLTPIKNGDTPNEIFPLVEAMNRLFIRIGDSFRREREFTDHAAHELRTPLAAMKTQTQVLLKKASSMPDCRDGLDNLNATIDRTTHLVEQLLSMARLQSDTPPMETINLSDILEEAAGQTKALVERKKQILNLNICPDIRIEGHPDSIYMLFHNLLDNAVKYTPEGGKIIVTLNPDKTVSISDTGPGISDADKKRVFNRFVRVDKTGQTGSGLGLSIAQWVAETHKAALSLHDNIPYGLAVKISFQ